MRATCGQMPTRRPCSMSVHSSIDIQILRDTIDRSAFHPIKLGRVVMLDIRARAQIRRPHRSAIRYGSPPNCLAKRRRRAARHWVNSPPIQSPVREVSVYRSQVSPGRAGFSPSFRLIMISGAGNGPSDCGDRAFRFPRSRVARQRASRKYQDSDESGCSILSGAEDLGAGSVQDASGNWRRERLPDCTRYTVTRYRPRVEGVFSVVERWSRAMTGTPIGVRSPKAMSPNVLRPGNAGKPHRSTPVVPEKSIRADSRDGAESGHHSMRCLRSFICLGRLSPTYLSRGGGLKLRTFFFGISSISH